MDKESVKEQMRDIKKRMRIIEWDKGRSGVMSKQHIYDRLKEEYGELAKKMEVSE